MWLDYTFSSFHHELIEHLNVEISLRTVTNQSEALKWLKSTFLYARILKNPRHYDITISAAPASATATSRVNAQLQRRQQERRIDAYLIDLCERNLASLVDEGLVECQADAAGLNSQASRLPIDRSNVQLHSTMSGQLMAQFGLAFETMCIHLRAIRCRRYEDECDEAAASGSNQANAFDALFQPSVSLPKMVCVHIHNAPLKYKFNNESI